MKTSEWLIVAALCYGMWIALGGQSPIAPILPTPTTKIVSATYVFEKDDTAVPAPVMATLDKLNRERGIVATVFDDDVVDGTGQTPDQYKPAVTAAKQVGLPALVTVDDKGVTRAVKDPKTETDVLEAVK